MYLAKQGDIGMSESDGEFHKVFLGILFLSYRGGLAKALEELAHFHDNKPGAWLDEIEAEIVNRIKTLVVEGVDMTLEADALNAAICEAERFFASFREGLGERYGD
jgi:hypothetical protein